MDTVDLILKLFGFDTPTSYAEDTTDIKSYIKGRNEMPEEFVQRLPPSQILRLGHADFIAVNSISNIHGLESFIKKGEELIKSYEDKYLNEKVQEQRAFLAEEFKEKIISLAKEEKFLEGSWMLFLPEDVVDYVWLQIVGSTTFGYLGTNAKVDRKISQYVIRVYTKDFTDMADVLQVLEHLNFMKLLGNGIQYECAAFSTLKTFEGNLLNIYPSIYRSNDFIQLQGDDNGFLYGIKEKNESPESFVSRLLPLKVLHSKHGFISIFKDECDKYDIEDKKSRCPVENIGKVLLQIYKTQIEMTPVPKRYLIIEELGKKLVNLAVECNFVKGRWTGYVTDNVDFLWLKTVEGTMNGTLGVNAKIRKYNNQYEINVITKDFNDEADVMRVLAEIEKLGITLPLVYRTDINLILGIIQNNIYGLNPYLHMVSTPRLFVPKCHVERPKRDTLVRAIASKRSMNFGSDAFKCMKPNESPADFVARCSPEKTVVAFDEWIFVGRRRRNVTNLEKFKKTAKELISTASASLEGLSAEKKALKTAELMKYIDEQAVKHGATEGQWMIFIPPGAQFIDKIWLDVVKAVVDGRFHGASISLKNYYKRGRSQVMNIATKNYTDVDDVGRVLFEINEMGLMTEVLNYRCDAYRCLDLTQNSILNVSQSIYKSDQFPM